MHNIDQLEALARQFQTDKQAGQNCYLPLYLEHFKRAGLERDAQLKILEIGTNKGSSVRMWTEYFENAMVYGLDITRTYELPGMLDNERLQTAIADQGDRTKLFEALRYSFGLVPPWIQGARPSFDIIIDDGSHEQTHQQVSWGYLFQWLKPGGLYIIEDLITGENWWDSDTYNRSRITPTREILQKLEQTGYLESPVMTEEEREHIQATYAYCNYRESSAVIYTAHHPQIAFVGKKRYG